MSTANVTQTGQAATVAVTVSRGLQGATGATGAQGTTDYNELDNVPSEFPPESHTHAVSDIVSISSHHLLGRHAGGSGAGQEVTVGNGLEFHGNGIRRSALTGDVTASAGSNSTTIANDAVTNAKLANVATATIKGRITAGTGDPEDLTPAQALEVIGAATPATVADQIEAATASGFIENPSGLLPMYNAVMGFDENSTVHAEPYFFTVMGFGDSMAQPYAAPLVEELSRVYGVGAWMTGSVGGPSANSGGTMSLSGGASIPSASYALTPGTNWINMPSGSSATHTLARTTETTTKATGGDTGISGQKINAWHGYRPLPGGCRKVAVLIATAPGAGTLGITVAQDQYANLTATVDTDAAAGFVASEFTPVDRHAPITVTVNASVATSTLIGVVYFSGDGGVFYWDAAEGGSTMESQLACLDSGEFKPAFAGLFDYLNTKMVFHHQRAANDTDALENYDTFFDAFDALGAGEGNGITQFVMGELPLLDEGAITIETHNAALRAKCKTRGYPFLDGQKLLSSQAQISAAGWVGAAENDVHFYGPCPRFVAGWIAHKCNHFRSALSLFQPGAPRVNFERYRDQMIEEAITDRIHLRNGYTLVSAVTSGSGYAATIDNTKGLTVTGGAAIGYTKQEIGSIGWGSSSTPNLNTNQLNHAVAINGLQSLSLLANQRAWLAVGLRAGNSHTSVATVTVRSFGLEFALGDDVGNPDGATGANRHAARLWLHDGTAVVYSRWFALGIQGDLVTSNAGFAMLFQWDLSTATLHCHLNVPGGFVAGRGLRPMASITSTAFAAGATHGSFVYAGIGAASAPAGTGFIAVKNITLKAGNLGYPMRLPT
jgi:hypothetical protein